MHLANERARHKGNRTLSGDDGGNGNGKPNSIIEWSLNN